MTKKFTPTQLKLLRPVPSDIEIAQASDIKPISQVAEELGILPDELELYGPYKAKVKLEILERLKDRPNGKYIDVTAITPTPLGEGKTTTTVGLEPGAWARTWARRSSPASASPPRDRPLASRAARPAAVIQPGHPDGRFQPAPDRRYPRHHRRQQPAGGRHRMRACCTKPTQDDEKLFNALCPPDKKGKRKFSPTMLRRLKKLGIDKTDPNELTPEERSRFARLDIDPAIDHLAARDGYQRPLPARDRSRSWARMKRASTHRTGYDITVASEIMAILALTTDLADMRERLGAMVIGTNTQRRSRHRRRPGCGRRADRPDEGRHQAQPDADPGRHARLRPCRAVRQHRPRTVLHHRRPDRPQTGRLRHHRIRLRRGHRHGKILRHQVPLLRPDPAGGGAGCHRARAEDARRRTEGGGRQTAGPRIHR